MDLPSGTFQESYAQDMAIVRTKTHWVMLIALLVFLFSLPLYFNDRLLSLLIMIGITIISVHGLNILTEYTGLISIGHAGFMAVGGYTSAVLTANFGWSFWAALPLATLMAGLVGFIFGLPSLRIKGFYLILVTVAAQSIIIWIILQLRDITGGTDGLNVPTPEIGGFVLSSKASYFYLVMIIASLATFFAKNILRTRVGRAFIAIRDNDLAAEVMGINVWGYKLLSFFIGCAFAGVAGSLLVHYHAFAIVELFSFLNSIWYLAMVLVGGAGTAGAIFGVVSLKLLDELVIIVGPTLAVIISPQAATALGLIMRGLVIILFLIFEPRGLIHWWGRFKAYYRLWPFSY